MSKNIKRIWKKNWEEFKRIGQQNCNSFFYLLGLAVSLCPNKSNVTTDSKRADAANDV